ncbi:sterol desaturase family protein [Brytella acorum]|uniref:Sterol desaturase family protein n=2 Tax=Brytella acorum TaxID=2959299 RepID=A0AA35UU81_9PROT|nr:sterol desaturase family protein [Brytella acorum]MDF3623957.1 sterol desaturase family protein [Brytella acorum]CAI9122203.1 sterol desaturase family protein [Brytella acorum]
MNQKRPSLRQMWNERASLQTGRSFDLGKMDLRQLWMAYLTYPTILFYFALIVICALATFHFRPSLPHVVIPALAVVVVYPLAWYLIHRFILHGRWLYRNPVTASLWKRVHFDHHQDPHLLDVLFGSPLNTVPTIGIIVFPIGYAIGGWGGAFAAATTGLVTTCVYEFFHCIQHLAYKPRWKWVSHIKQLHVLHHFHDENGNYGITNYMADRVFGSFYENSRARPRSAHVFNLGYTVEEARRYPWVMEQTGSPPRDRPETARESARDNTRKSA